MYLVVRIYPFPNLKSTLTCYQLTVAGFGEGQAHSCSDTDINPCHEIIVLLRGQLNDTFPQILAPQYHFSPITTSNSTAYSGGKLLQFRQVSIVSSKTRLVQDTRATSNHVYTSILTWSGANHRGPVIIYRLGDGLGGGGGGC